MMVAHMIRKALNVAFLTMISAQAAFAASDVGHAVTDATMQAAGHGTAAAAPHDAGHGAAAAHGAAHGSGGLPQLDPSSFPSQLFWLALVFGFLYLFFSRKSLPEIAQVIENRSDRIQNDLDTAQRLKNEVAAVQKSYEDNIAKSRNEASSLFKSMEDDMKAKADAEGKRLQDATMQKTAELEKSISRARSMAMEDMNRIASEIAVDAAEKIIGVRPDLNDASEIVKTLHKTGKTAKAA
jgi:F-type H+-transporting ATPase subunit b